MVDVEVWFAQKTELSWFLRSNTKIEQFLSYRKAALSETDFFNGIGRKQSSTSTLMPLYLHLSPFAFAEASLAASLAANVNQRR
ncbi:MULTISPECIES: hypothetical protein [unclassified Pseudomonas]|uniref:hypothetical protein n=1 Tax=unclassified Pseudomonas TaxID=196821 RepID=UPI0002CB35A4|nr:MULTISPECIES: hypothetical protein [unclassified Pseudomonas]ENA27351.1 hypothetical protein HMPREF1487_09315 [Pseudomonas sp. HPB0071]MBW5414881.1 hypothetical protein [Pseudomonas sp. MAG002Y]